MASRLVNITRAFTLTLLTGGQVVRHRIEAGIQRLEEDAADHWYTKAHSAPVPKGVKQSDAEAAADAAAEAEEAERVRVEAEQAEAARVAAEQQKAADAAAAKDGKK